MEQNNEHQNLSENSENKKTTTKNGNQKNLVDLNNKPNKLVYFMDTYSATIMALLTLITLLWSMINTHHTQKQHNEEFIIAHEKKWSNRVATNSCRSKKISFRPIYGPSHYRNRRRTQL